MVSTEYDGRLYIELGGGNLKSTTTIPPDDFITGSLDLEHTAISGVSADVVAKQDYRDYAGADLRVYYGQNLLMNGRLDSATVQGGTVTLEGRGPLTELLADTTIASYSNVRAVDAIRDYVSNVPGNWTVNDPYVNVIYPDLQIYDTTQTAFVDDVVVADPTEPVTADSDTVRLAQTCWPAEAENVNYAGTIVERANTDEDYSNLEAVELSSGGDLVSIDFTPEHTIPDADFDFRIRASLQSFSGYLRVRLDGDLIYELGYPDGQTATSSLQWRGGRDPTVSLGDLDAGTTHTLEAYLSSYYGGSLRIDMIAPFDSGDRYSDSLISYNYNWDESLDLDTFTLSGPEKYPESYPVPLEVGDRIWHISEATLDTVIDDVTGSQSLRLSPNGDDWLSSSNTQTFTADFDAAEIYGSDVVAEIVLSRYTSDPTTTPDVGDSSQLVDDITLTAVADDLPMIEDMTLTGNTWLDNIQTLHDAADARAVVDHTADSLTVESFRVADSSVVQADDWMTDGQEAVERGRDTKDYANQLNAYAQDGSTSLALVNQDEQDRYGGIEEASRTFSVGSRDELAREARRELRTLVRNDQQSGSIQIVPKYVQPGYPYQPDEFGGNLTNAERVSISFNDDSGSIEFGSRTSLTTIVQSLNAQ